MSLLASQDPSVVFGCGTLVGAVGVTVLVPLLWRASCAAVQQVRFAVERRGFPAIKAKKRKALDDAWQQALSWVAQAEPTADEIATLSNLKLDELAKGLRAGTFTSTKLLRVFYRTAHEAHKKTNCVVHLFVTDAIAAAETADHVLSHNAADKMDQLPPLYGIPISIKDSTSVQGADCTRGLFGCTLRPATEDAACVVQLKDAGAIVFVKTNIPTLLMSHECENDVFGECVNPVNGKYTCGGSSGGEAALIKLAGSPAGMGSDVGGSIRIPAHFCGIYGLKPSLNRVAYRGCCPEQGDEGVAPVSGPLGRCVNDLVVMFRVLTPSVPFGHDGMQFNVPFNERSYSAALSKQQLKILYYREDGFVQTSPACRRAVDLAVAEMQAQGHRLVEWAPPITQDVLSMFFELFSADRARTLQRSLGSDRACGVIGPCIQLAQFPDKLKWLLGWVYGYFLDPAFGTILSRLKERSIDEYFDLLMRRNRLRHRYAEMMRGYDCIIGPGFTTPAPLLQSTIDQPFGAVCTAVYNVLDLSVVTVPVTTVDRNLDQWTTEHLAQAKNKGMTQSLAAPYDADAMHGLPVGVQVVTPRMTEEWALGIAKRLENALAG